MSLKLIKMTCIPKYVMLLLSIFLSVHMNVAQEVNAVPVILWSRELLTSLDNPLKEIQPPQFKQMLEKQFKKVQPPIAVFLFDDDFCIEDIRLHQESLQKLNNSGSLSYLTSVESPLSVFENLSVYNITQNSIKESFTGIFSKLNKGQIAFNHVSDFDNLFHMSNAVKESNPSTVIAITGKSCRFFSTERVKRSIHSSIKASNFLIQTKPILFSADATPSLQINNENLDLKFINSNVETDSKHYNLTMNFLDGKREKISLTAQFNNVNGYFHLVGFEYSSANMNNEKFFLKSKNDIVFPYNVSYHCQKNNLFHYKHKENDILLKLTNIQVQMDTENFDAVYDCIGFMSISIWTGLFVMTILAIIIIWGLIMIIDIRTMDHFDDPKGKTITIATQD